MNKVLANKTISEKRRLDWALIRIIKLIKKIIFVLLNDKALSLKLEKSILPYFEQSSFRFLGATVHVSYVPAERLHLKPFPTLA